MWLLIIRRNIGGFICQRISLAKMNYIAVRGRGNPNEENGNNKSKKIYKKIYKRYTFSLDKMSGKRSIIYDRGKNLEVKK